MVLPIEISAGRFPITDELGSPTGLYLKMTGTPATEYLFKVSTPADPNYGATATLEIEFERPAYLNALQLAPFSTFPVHLKASTPRASPPTPAPTSSPARSSWTGR